MRKLIFFPFILLFITCFSLKAQQPDSKDPLAVKQAISNLFDGVSNLDTKLIKQDCTPDFLLLEDGQVWNMDTLVNKLLTPGPKFTRVNKLNFIAVKVSGPNAWVAYHNTGQFNSSDGKQFEINWLESAVLIKQNNHWVISMLHSTMLKPTTQAK